MAKEDKAIKKAAPPKAKKRWVQILGPKSFAGTDLGETYVENAEKAIGKTITVNLMNISGDVRKQGVEIRFDVVSAKEGKAHAVVTGYELVPSMIKRIVRRGRSKIQDSFVVKTATGRHVRIKPLIVTMTMASSGACTMMRNNVRQKIAQVVGSMSFDKLVHELISQNLQRVIRDVAAASHPVKAVEVKTCLLLPEGGTDTRKVTEDTREEDFVVVKPAEPTPAPEAPAPVAEDISEQA